MDEGARARKGGLRRCSCSDAPASAGFALVDSEFEALLILRADGEIVTAHPHDSYLFDRLACSATKIDELVPREWLAVLGDRVRSSIAMQLPSTIELERTFESSEERQSVRVRISPDADSAYVLVRDLSFDPRRQFSKRTNDDATFWAFFELAPIALSVGLASSSQAIGPTRFNRRFTSLFGYTSDDIPTVQHWWPLAYPDEAYRNRLRDEWFRRLAAAGGDTSLVAPMEVDVRCKDGTTREIEIYTSTIGDYHVVAFVDLTERNTTRRELATRVDELEVALSQVKVLRGLIPLCAWCRKIRDDQGYWNRVEEFLAKNTDSQVTHGICPSCFETHFADAAK